MSLLNTLLPEFEIAIAQGSPKRRSDMLFSVLDIFVQSANRFSEEEIALFDDIIIRLASEIELAARERLASGLAPIARAPLKIIRLLACDDEIRVAQPILSQSVRVDETVLAQVARSKSQAHLVAIARRKSLSETITDILIERGNREVLLTVSTNLNAKFSASGFSGLVKRSEGDDTLATSVGLRSDLPRPLLIFLLKTASDVVRKKLVSERKYGSDEIRKAIRAVTGDLGDGDDRSNELSAEAPTTPGLPDVTTLRKLAETGQFDKTIESLARLSGAPIDAVKQALSRNRTETLLILARAAGLSWALTKPLLTNPAQPLAKPAELERIRLSFEHLATHTAQQIIEFYKLRNAKSAVKKM